MPQRCPFVTKRCSFVPQRCSFVTKRCPFVPMDWLPLAMNGEREVHSRTLSAPPLPLRERGLGGECWRGNIQPLNAILPPSPAARTPI